MGQCRVLFVYANCMMDNLIPVGASSVIGALKQAGIEVELFDTTFYRTEARPADYDRVENLQVPEFDYSELGISIKDEDVFEAFARQVENYKPNVIMLSVVESTWPLGEKMLSVIKGNRPYTIVGGVFAILFPQEIIASRFVDAVCIGEGELAAVEFCQKITNGEDYSDIAGMWIKAGDTVIKNKIVKALDLDNLPFLDFSLYEKERFYKPMQGKIFKMVPLEFSRGCPYRCSYCANHALEKAFKSAGRWYRWKSLDRIFAEIEHYLSTYKVEFFYFVSESFLSMKREKFEEFCARYKKYKIPFWFNSRPETLNREIIAKLEKINCFRMGIGLEHGNPRFREEMLNRRVSNKKIIEACRLVESSKISYSINNIIGFPGETREMIFDTIRLNKQISPNSVGTFVFTPFKGTELYNYCLLHGYIRSDTPSGDLNRGSVLENNILSAEQIKGLLRTFPLYVHFDERYYDQIERAEQLTKEGSRVFRGLAKQYISEHFGGK